MKLTEALVPLVALSRQLVAPGVLFARENVAALIQDLAFPLANVPWMYSIFRSGLCDLPVILNRLTRYPELQIRRSACT